MLLRPITVFSDFDLPFQNIFLCTFSSFPCILPIFVGPIIEKKKHSGQVRNEGPLENEITCLNLSQYFLSVSRLCREWKGLFHQRGMLTESDIFHLTAAERDEGYLGFFEVS